ncbi:MAG: zf-HC2 domain-containing protein [Gemmatimonadetes bacterium]|nr:zf-HC2 domain-containing protein [Gemmatimonadota bacterium]
MHDPWIDLLADSIDGVLSAADEAALQEHLAACEACRGVAAELRAVVEAARTAPAHEPAVDLWPGIRKAIAESVPLSAADAAALATENSTRTPVMRIRPARTGNYRFTRRLSLSVPQLAAAAVLLMALSGGAAVWLMGRSDSQAVAAGTIIQSAGGDAGSVQTVAARVAAAQAAPPDYAEDVTTLERALQENRAQLDPVTVEVIERSLESIDRAIEDARTALEADPGNPYLHRQLDNTMRRKVDVLRRATGA